MTPRATYYIQILKTIGSPLIAHAIKNGDGSAENNAKTVASLLSQSVQTGIDLSALIDLGPIDEADDSMRVAMTGLAARLLSISDSNKIDSKSLKDSVQAALSFADNFTPTALNTQRLQDLAAQGQIVDESQLHVQYLHAFLPVIESVASFSFGQTATKLINDIASRLSIHADKIAKTLVDSDDALEKQRISLAVMEGLGQIYAACHAEQTEIIAQNNAADVTTDTVWEAFNLRFSLLKTLTDAIMNKGQSDTANNDNPSAAPETIGTPEATTQTPPPKQEDKKQKEEIPPAKTNPMGVFAKKPASSIPPKATSSPSPETPASPKKADDVNDKDNADGADDPSASSQPSNPMSFFKNPPPDE